MLLLEGHLSIIEKSYNEFKIHSNKQTVEEVLFERALKATLQILYDKGLFDNYDNADAVFKDYLPFEVNEGCRPDLEELNDDNVIQ